MQAGDRLLRLGDLEAALARYGEEAPADAESAEVEAVWAERTCWVLLRQGEYASVLLRCNRALRQVQHGGPVAACLYAAGSLANCFAGHLDAADRWVDDGLALLPPLLSGARWRRAAVMLLRAKGNAEVERGELARAVETHRRAIDTCAPEMIWERSIAEFNVGDALVRDGRHAEALEILDLAETHKVDVEDRWGLAYVQRTRARALRALGFVTDAYDVTSRGLALAEAVGDPKLLASLEIERGKTAALSGDFADAEEAGERAASLARAHDAVAERVEAAIVLARVELWTQGRSVARGRAAWAMKMASRRGLKTELAEASTLMAVCSSAHDHGVRVTARSHAAEASDPYASLALDCELAFHDAQHGTFLAEGIRSVLVDRAEELGAPRLAALARASVAHDRPAAGAELRLAEAQLRVLGARPDADAVEAMILQVGD